MHYSQQGEANVGRPSHLTLHRATTNHATKTLHHLYINLKKKTENPLHLLILPSIFLATMLVRHSLVANTALSFSTPVQQTFIVTYETLCTHSTCIDSTCISSAYFDTDQIVLF